MSHKDTATTFSRLISQCAIQPGLGKVYSQILLQSHTSAEFYLKVTFPKRFHLFLHTYQFLTLFVLASA